MADAICTPKNPTITAEPDSANRKADLSQSINNFNCDALEKYCMVCANMRDPDAPETTAYVSPKMRDHVSSYHNHTQKERRKRNHTGEPADSNAEFAPNWKTRHFTDSWNLHHPT